MRKFVESPSLKIKSGAGSELNSLSIFKNGKQILQRDSNDMHIFFPDLGKNPLYLLYDNVSLMQKKNFLDELTKVKQ